MHIYKAIQLFIQLRKFYIYFNIYFIVEILMIVTFLGQKNFNIIIILVYIRITFLCSGFEKSRELQ